MSTLDPRIPPGYPGWVRQVMHLDIPAASRRRTAFESRALESWFHPDQVNGIVKGYAIYEYLKKNCLLDKCLGLYGLETIRKLGTAHFRRNYKKGEAVFGWASVVEDEHKSLLVPYLVEIEAKVVLCWCWLGNDWDKHRPALRFSK